MTQGLAIEIVTVAVDWLAWKLLATTGIAREMVEGTPPVPFEIRKPVFKLPPTLPTKELQY
jgi:hypothetical protein